MSNELDTQQAIRDLELIRSILSTSGQSSEIRAKGNTRALQSQVIIHSGTLLVVASFILLELFRNHINTQFLLASSFSRELLYIGISNLSLMLFVGLVAFYYVAFWAARNSELNINDYLKHHFIYLSNFSFIADLLVKFVTISLLLLAKHPEWISPVLTLFTADYLFQRRFFYLPLRTSMALGVVCLGIAAAQFILHSPHLLWSLLTFFMVGTLSLTNVYRLHRLEVRA